MNEVRTFRARTLHDALNVVRRELGSEAVILQTRRTPTSRLWPWARRDVEVTARTDPHPAPSIGGPAVLNRLMPDSAIVSTGMNQTDLTSSDAKSAPDFGQQAVSLQQLIDQLTKRLEPGRQELPEALQGLFEQLTESEVSDEIATQWISRVQREYPHAKWDNIADAQVKLATLIERELNCTGGIHVSPTRRKVVALVGSTGVGKTTTVAKLAANFKLRAGLRVGLVTLDGYRIAAADQLRTYAEIIGIPMRVVSDVREMRQVMDDFRDLDVVLVDTAGRSPGDDLQRQELKSLLEVANADEVHLVLSLATSMASNIRTIKKFAHMPVSSLILTKIDEASGLGHLLGAWPEMTLPISYLTTGQDVPNDIEPAISAKLARMIVGLEEENLATD